MINIFFKLFGVERRRNNRADVRVIVMYKINAPSRACLATDKEVNAIMMNLSEQGMSILSNYDIPVSTVVTLKFILTNPRGQADADRLKNMEIKGLIRYSYFTRERAYRMGIQFIDLQEDDRRFLAGFISSANKRQ